MNQITKTVDPQPQRADSSRAPRGEELKEASSRFAELLQAELKEAKPLKSNSGRADDSVEECGDGKAFDADGRPLESGSLSYGIHLPGERGQNPQQNHSPQQCWAEPEARTGGDRTEPSNDATIQIQVEVPQLLGGPIQSADSDARRDSWLPLEPKPKPFFAEEALSERSLPTPGELMLQAFSATRVEAPRATANVERVSQTDLSAVMELGEQIAERILVSRPDSAGPQEMLIHLKDSAIAGTQVRMTQVGDRVQVTVVTDNASSFHLLAARQADLQAKLGDAVVVQLSFDPEGMVSQQRLERPIAADAGNQAGPRDRERESEGRRRNQRRDEEQEQDS